MGRWTAISNSDCSYSLSSDGQMDSQLGVCQLVSFSLKTLLASHIYTRSQKSINILLTALVVSSRIVLNQLQVLVVLCALSTVRSRRKPDCVYNQYNIVRDSKYYSHTSQCIPSLTCWISFLAACSSNEFFLLLSNTDFYCYTIFQRNWSYRRNVKGQFSFNDIVIQTRHCTVPDILLQVVCIHCLLAWPEQLYFQVDCTCSVQSAYLANLQIGQIGRLVGTYT